MNSPDDATAQAPRSHPPRHGWLVIGAILIVMALLALYSNAQKARRSEIETVTIAPAKASSPVPSPAAP